VATQLNVTITQNNSGTVTTSTVTVAIPASLQSLDSTAQGATQTGYSAVDQMVRDIFRANGFSDGNGNWYPLYVVQKITSQ
jgi:hypothetical protein